MRRSSKHRRSDKGKAPRWLSTTVAWGFATFGVAACVTQDPSESNFSTVGATANMGASGASETESDGPTGTGSTADSTTDPSTTDGAYTTSGPGSGEGSASSVGDTSGGEPEPACSILEQDCPDGHKCTIWASQGGDVPDDVLCVPLVDGAAIGNHGVHGDRCQVTEPLSGHDDCDVGLYCQVDNPADQVDGFCVTYCRSVSGEQDCENPDEVCGLLFGGVAPICLSPCDVESDHCPEGQVCHKQTIGPTVCVGEGWGT